MSSSMVSVRCSAAAQYASRPASPGSQGRAYHALVKLWRGACVPTVCRGARVPGAVLSGGIWHQEEEAEAKEAKEATDAKEEEAEAKEAEEAEEEEEEEEGGG